MSAHSSYAKLLQDLNNVARQMTLWGIKTDPAAIAKHKETTTNAIESARRAFAAIAGSDYQLFEDLEEDEAGEGALDTQQADLDKRDRLADLFFEKWGVKPKYFSKKTGKPSLNKSCLHDLLAEGELKPRAAARELLKYRAADKTRQFLAGLSPIIHTTWNAGATETNRWTERPYGIQRIKKPETDKDGNVTSAGLKDCFVPDRDDLYFVAADKSQLEMRINAVFAGDQPLLAIFKAGGSVHRQNAKDLFGTDTDTAYNIAKTFAYAVAYDAAVETVYRQLVIKFPDISRAFVKALMAKWFTAHPALVAYKEEQLDFARQNGYTWLPVSDRRYYYYLGSAKPSAVINQRIQTTGSDDMNPATLRVFNALNAQEQLKAQVHDELLCQGPDPIKLAAMMKREMDSEITYRGNTVKLPVEIKVGKSWGTMKKVAV